MNCAVFCRRFDGYAEIYHLKALSAVVELERHVAGHFLLTSSSFTVWPTRLACAGSHAGGAVFRWRQLLHDLPERGDWRGIVRLLRYRCRSLERDWWGCTLYCI